MKKIVSLMIVAGILVMFSGSVFAQGNEKHIYLDVDIVEDFTFDNALVGTAVTGDTVHNVTGGSGFYISLYASNVDSMIGFDIKIAFDGTYITYATFATILTDGFVTQEESPINNAPVGVTQYLGGVSGGTTTDTLVIAQSMASSFEGVNVPDSTFLGRITFLTDAAFTVDDAITFFIANGDFSVKRAGSLVVESPPVANMHNCAINGGMPDDEPSSVDPGDPIPIPTTTRLGQNYPNPFNPSTTIPFTLKQTGMVTLTVYNILGQKVSTLVNSVMTAGEKDVSFNAHGLASGMYFYRLETEGYSSMKKFVVLK